MNTIYEPTSINGTIEQGISYAKNRVSAPLHYIIKDREKSDLDGLIGIAKRRLADNHQEVTISTASQIIKAWAWEVYQSRDEGNICFDPGQIAAENFCAENNI